MKDDPSLRDEQLEDEIRLVGELVLAASQSEGRLAQDAIDEVLGRCTARRAPARPSPRPTRRRGVSGLRHPATRHPRSGPSL